MSFLVRMSDQLGQPIEPKAMPQPNSLAVDSRRVRCSNDGSDGDVNPCAIFSSVLTLQLDHLCTRIRHSTERPQLAGGASAKARQEAVVASEASSGALRQRRAACGAARKTLPRSPCVRRIGRH